MGKYKPLKNKPNRPEDMRGAPFYMDQTIYWLLKTLFQLPIFILFYMVSVGSWKSQGAYLPLWEEIIYIIFLLIISDLLAFLIASMLDEYIIHRWGYLRNPRTKNLRMLVVTQYFFYVVFRALSYAFALVWILSAALYPSVKGWSFLIAWLICSIGAKLLSFLTASVFFTRF